MLDCSEIYDERIMTFVPLAICDGIRGVRMNDDECDSFSGSGPFASCCEHARNSWYRRSTPVRICKLKDTFYRAVRADVDRADSELCDKLEEL